MNGAHYTTTMIVFIDNLQAIRQTGMRAGSPTVALSRALHPLPPPLRLAPRKNQERINPNSEHEEGETGEAEDEEGGESEEGGSGIRTIKGVLVTRNSRPEALIFRTAEG